MIKGVIQPFYEKGTFRLLKKRIHIDPILVWFRGIDKCTLIPDALTGIK